jgi:hypothetical protein
MTFLTPYMLWGAAAASIPIAIHLFFRSRYRTVPWAAMKFLLESIEQTSRRLKFQELLLLLLRIAVLVLLALALARPLSSAFSGSGGSAAVDVVFVFDTSFSMGALEGEKTLLELAKEAALKVLDELPPYSAVHILDTSSKPALLGPRVPYNLDQARYLIDNLRLTHLPTDFRPAVKDALQVLKNSQMTGKEFYLFSDMQKLGWETDEAPLIEDLRDFGKLGSVYLVRCGTKVPLNVAVIAITPQFQVPRPGERVGFGVLVANTSKEPAKNLNVTLLVDGDKESAETATIGLLDPGKTTTVTLNAKMQDAGLHVITAAVGSDELAEDNRLDQVIQVRDNVRVLVIEGTTDPSRGQDPKTASKSASYYLGHALLPIKEEARPTYVLQVETISPRQATADLLVDKDLCILVDVALPAKKEVLGAETVSAEFIHELDKFVREGRSLLIFPGHKVKPADYNAALYEQYQLLPFPIAGERLDPKKDSPLHFNKDSVALAAYKQFRDDKQFQIGDAEIWQAIAVVEAAAKKKTPAAGAEPKEPDALEGKKPPAPGDGTATATVALRYEDGSAAIISNKVDAGEVILFTAAAHPSWDPAEFSDALRPLPTHPSFIPLIRTTLFHLLQQQTQDYNVVAGNPLTWFAPPKESRKNFVLLQPDGNKRQLGSPVPDKDRFIIKLENLPQAGVHALVTLDDEGKIAEKLNDPVLVDELRQGKVTLGRPVAVTPDLRESENLEALSDEQIDSKLGFPVVHVIAGSNSEQYGGLERTNREWTLWVLLLVLGVAVSESALAWYCGRPI